MKRYQNVQLDTGLDYEEPVEEIAVSEDADATEEIAVTEE